MARQKKSDFIDFRGIIGEYMSKWYWFVISIFVCCCIGFLATKIFKPKYAVNANVLIAQEDKSGLAALGAIGDILGSKGKVDDEIFVISSHSLLRDVARDLGIYKMHYVRKGFLNTEMAYPDFPVDVIAAPGVVDTLRIPISFKIKVNDKGLVTVKAKALRKVVADVKDAEFPVSLTTEYGHFVVDTTSFFERGKSLKTTVNILGFDAVAEALSKDVSATIGSKKSNAIRLFMKTVNTDYGKDVLNEIIEKYNIRGIAEKNLQGEKTAKFIDERLSIISGDLTEAESDIQTYKEAKGIIGVEAEAAYQTGKRSKIEESLVEAETQGEIIKLTGEFISNPENAYSLIPMTTENKGVQDAITAYNELILERMSLASNAKPNNKALKILDEQIEAMRVNIATSVNKAYESVMVTVNDLRGQMKSAMGVLSGVPSQEREFLNMKRQQEVKQQLYLFLLQRREETAMLLANATPKGIIVDEAFAFTRPVSISKMVIMLIAFIIGCCIPPVVLYIRKILRTKFDTKEEIETMIDVPVLGEVCQDKSGRSLVTVAGDHSSTTELFNLLRSHLPFVLGEDINKVVMLTSTRSGEGKSFISINLAASMALLDKRVLLIGMDVRKPRLSEYLDIRPRFGLTQYLVSNNISIDDMIVSDQRAPGLDIITAGPVPPNPAEILTSKRLDALFEELRSRYDYIIIDSAPVGMVSDAFAVNRLADATIYVVRANYTLRSDLRYLEDLYEEKRLKKVSIVINGTVTKRGYGYGYGESNK